MNTTPFLSSLRVIVVDDDDTLGGLVALALEGLGVASVSRFTQPREALAAIADRPAAIDLVITDRDMPELNGLEFSKRVHELADSTPILLMTANVDSLNDGILARLGISALLPKPFPLSRLEAIIRSIGCESIFSGTGVRHAA